MTVLEQRSVAGLPLNGFIFSISMPKEISWGDFHRHMPNIYYLFTCIYGFHNSAKVKLSQINRIVEANKPAFTISSSAR